MLLKTCECIFDWSSQPDFNIYCYLKSGIGCDMLVNTRTVYYLDVYLRRPLNNSSARFPGHRQILDLVSQNKSCSIFAPKMIST